MSTLVVIALVTVVCAACERSTGAAAAGATTQPTSTTRTQPATEATTTSDEEETAVQIRLIMDGEVLTATLDDSASARDFVSMLPLELTLRDYAETEKVSELPRELDIAGAPSGIDPEVGDLTYYAPWGNLAIFYRDFGYADGLVKLGHIVDGIDELAHKEGEFAVRIEHVDGRQPP